MAKTQAAAPPKKRSKTTSKSFGGGATSQKSRTQSKTKFLPSVDLDHPTTSSAPPLREVDNKQFYPHLQFDPSRDGSAKSDPATRPALGRDADGAWRVGIGDLACVEVEGPADRDGKHKKFPPGKTEIAAPFAVRWRPCQILSVYRERLIKKLSTKKHWGPLKIEVRWFYRHADLDDRNRWYEESLKERDGKHSKGTGKCRKGASGEEVFESGHIARLDASMLRGRFVLGQRPGLDTKTSKVIDDSSGYPVPTVVGHCRRYYLHEEQDIFDLYDWGNIKRRGLECSELLKIEGLRNASYNCLGLHPPGRSGDGVGDDPLVSLPTPAKKYQGKDKVRTFYPFCTLTHRWSQLKHRDLLCPQLERGSFPKWKLSVGDIVAVHCEESMPATDADAIPGREKWYPYCVPWSHCQVTAIYQTFDSSDSIPEEESSVPATLPSFEIRWFPRVSEARAVLGKGNKRVLEQLNQISNDVERTSETILEGEQISIIDSESILGAVLIDEGSVNTLDENPVPKFLPQNRRTVSHFVGCNSQGRPSSRDCDPTHRLERGFDASKQYMTEAVLKAVQKSRKERAEQIRKDRIQATEGEIIETESVGAVDGASDIAAEPTDRARRSHKKRKLVGEDCSDNSAEIERLRSSANDALAEKVPRDKTISGRTSLVGSAQSNAKEEKQSTVTPRKARARFCSGPFQVDVSALKSFYEEVEITPSMNSYDSKFSAGGSAMQWKVKLGDTVTVELEQTSKDSSVAHFPFAVPWSPAEVVCIYQLHKTKESCARLREQLSRTGQLENSTPEDIEDGDIMIEVRWLYRPDEIPGESKKKMKLLDGDLEEVFETDQISNCSADSILSPIRLHDVTKMLNAPSVIYGMPCINYHCSRFWSIHRRSFVPSGSLNNRVSRGRMHSEFRAALNKLQPAASTTFFPSSSEKSWKVAFESAIHQLSLAAAAHDAHEAGTLLACREKERDQIATFLRKAIRGSSRLNKNEGKEEEETKNIKSSMFIAGQPGTGKTASVRSVIAELQREQQEGLLPEFNFIALNGMELRHPFDAYVKFWEYLSGTRKERLTAGDAANELEYYFCGDQDQESGDSGGEEGQDNHEEFNYLGVSEKPVTVLMLDEVDYLVTKKETLLYNFFDWPLRATTARLVVIGISNTITLPEKMSTRVLSRIGGNRCYFRSYSVQDTVTILKTRLGMLGKSPSYLVFDEDAIKFAARKTANLSGDIRKAFQMCKVAAESVYEDYNSGKRQFIKGSSPIVRISDVQKSSRDAFTSILIKAVSCSTTYEALLLISLGALKKTRDDGMFTLRDVLAKIESIANASGEYRYMNSRLSFADLLGMANRLGDAGIIQLKTFASSPWPWISTHLHTYEVLAAYRDTSHRKLADKHLANQKLF